MSNREVPGYGPYTAPMLFVGEAPGPTEVKEGRPFVGATGRRVRRLLHVNGVDPEHDVRFNNVIPVNPGKIPGNLGGLINMVRPHWSNLDTDLARMQPKVIVACGRAALWRLTGLSDITKETGGVIYGKQAVPVVPVLHPAGVMRTKLGAGWLLIDKALSRAARISKGEVLTPPEINLYWPSSDELDALLSGTTLVAFDCEFGADGKPFLLGLTVDGQTCLSVRPQDPDIMSVLRKHFARRDLTKVAHMHSADVGSLARGGIDCRGPFVDTLLGFAMLYPDLPVGLTHVSRYYLDGVCNWKGMAHDDPIYNAMDVLYTWHCWQSERRELEESGQMEVFLREVMPAAALSFGLEIRGIQVDRERRDVKLRENEEAAAGLLASILLRTNELYRKRSAPFIARMTDLEMQLNETFVFEGESCRDHPTYTGKRRKKFTTSETCTCSCLGIYEAGESRREVRAAVQKARNKLKAPIARWAKSGFNPGNNDHLKWLLYDKDGLGLPTQRNKEGKLSANADAIARLGAHAKVQARGDVKDVLSLLADIKAYQHLGKERNTFILLYDKKSKRYRFGEDYVAHPPVRNFGTGTGRPAGGAERSEDKGSSTLAYNILNIPKDCRDIYIPHIEVAPQLVIVNKDDYEEGDDDFGDPEDAWPED